MTLLSKSAIFAALSALTLSGCANRPVDPARLDALLGSGLDPKAQESADARLASALSRGEDAATRGELYGDLASGDNRPTAGALVQAAMVRNARIAAAAEGIAVSDAQRLAAIFGYLPQVTASYTYQEMDQRVIESDNAVFLEGEAQYPVTMISARIEQPIFDLSRVFAINYAGNARTKAEVDYIGTVRDVAYETLDAYLIAVQSKARATYLGQRARLIDRQLAAQDALNDTGLGDVIEPDALRSERASLASEQSVEWARYSESLGKLAYLTGSVVEDVDMPKIPSGVMGSERRSNVDELVERGLRENPSVMSAALTVVGAELERRRAIAADFSPVLEAYATLEREDRADSRFGGGSLTEDQVLGLQLSIPLFNGRGTGYDMPVSNARLRQQTMEYYALRRQLETEIRALHTRMGELTSAVGQASAAARDAGRALETERNRFEAGETVDLVVAAREVRLNQTRERTAYYQAEYLRAWLRLQYLTGVDLRHGF